MFLDARRPGLHVCGGTSSGDRSSASQPYGLRSPAGLDGPAGGRVPPEDR
jgi:hypothetical protein